MGGNGLKGGYGDKSIKTYVNMGRYIIIKRLNIVRPKRCSRYSV